MTDQEKREAARITMPLVALVAVVGAFFLGLFWASDPAGRTALLGLLIAVTTGIVTVINQKLANKVDRLSRAPEIRRALENEAQRARGDRRGRRW